MPGVAVTPAALEAWAEALPHIVAHAADMRFTGLARDLQAFVDRLRPDDAEDRYDRLLDGRHRQEHGSVDYDDHGLIKVWSDPISYGIIANELDRLTKPLYEQDRAAVVELLGRDPAPGEVDQLTRTFGQRAHDARKSPHRHDPPRPGVRIDTNQPTPRPTPLVLTARPARNDGRRGHPLLYGGHVR